MCLTSVSAFGNYTLRDNQDVSKFYLLFQKNGGANAPFAPPWLRHCVALVVAKTRVAPLKRLTIPRLELCGASVLSKLLTYVCLSLNIHTFTWSDSNIVLHWLDGNSKRYRTFVGNRISTVLDQLPPNSWHHVPTKDNPADCATRAFPKTHPVVAGSILACLNPSNGHHNPSFLALHTGAKESCL